MQKVLIVFLLVVCISVTRVVGQNKAIVLQNVWNNDLNNYNPKEYVDKLFELLKTKLAVHNFLADSKNITSARKDESWDKEVSEQVKVRKAAGDNAYFIAMASELRLPGFNLGKFLFKNPPRSSKLIFTLHIYDTSGREIIGDTLINRGCLIRTIDEQKGSKFFYSDYNDFMSDIKCHLQAIGKMLQEKQLTIKQKRYAEAR